MVFHWSLSDSKCPQVSRTLLSILAVLNNVLVWMVFSHPLISKSSSVFNNLLVTVPKAPITIGIIVTFMFLWFFNSLARSRYLSFFSLSFNFILGKQSPQFCNTALLADGFPLESNWLQVSPSFQDSSYYSGRSQYCCSLDNLHSFTYFQVLQSLCQSFGDCTERNWYHRYFHVP